jgi:uncharacterized membrane protein (UPF0127 family)
MILRNITSATPVVARLTIADTPLTRLIGLMGKKQLHAGCGLLIRPSCGIHTFGMLFPIDVVALSKDLQVLKFWHSLVPLRMTGLHLKAHSMLELPAGEILHSRIEVGDQLEII